MKKIKVEMEVRSGIDKVWEYWNSPEHIKQWAFASDDWECPHAENDLREGGKFLTRMAAKDGSAAFDIVGTYTKVVSKEKIEYAMIDSRTVAIEFKDLGNSVVKIVEEFDPENENSEELQRSGWQSILNNFKKHVEQG